MSSLVKRLSWTLQYIDQRRSPDQKQFSLRTKSKRRAKRIKAELDDLYLRGLFDPWTDDFREALERQKRPGKPQKLLALTEVKERFITSRQRRIKAFANMKSVCQHEPSRRRHHRHGEA